MFNLQKQRNVKRLNFKFDKVCNCTTFTSGRPTTVFLYDNKNTLNLAFSEHLFLKKRRLSGGYNPPSKANFAPP